MVHGLSHFTNYFSALKSEYVIVGGTASTVLLENAGIKFRATKDIDLVIISSDTEEFAKMMIQYIRDGQYEVQEKNEGNPKFYRFKKPENPAFPIQVEIFHKKPDGIDLFEDQHIIPIKTPNEDLGISAILLNREYFELIRENTTLNGVIPTTSTLATIVLKAKAYNDLCKRKEQGESVDSKEIKKHQNDVFRLAQAITQGDSMPLSGLPKYHFENFLEKVASDSNFPKVYKSLKLNISFTESLELLRTTLLPE